MIQLLDENTINQIAAGEVIERPMAVVKELLDNSLDAGATAVTVEIKEGGISFIRITDNGDGIQKDEIPKAFLRHATSKIRSSKDLSGVKSLGFRGEALSSIAAVAKVELITKITGDLIGTHYEIHGGKEISVSEVGCPDGTTFIVRDLFFNTPARRKFLKSKTTEGNYIHEIVQRYSMAHPDIRFSFISDGKIKLTTSGDGDLRTNIYYIYGSEVAKELIPTSYHVDDMQIEGYIAKPSLSRGNRSYMNYFVNGRYIKSNVIQSAIEQGYKDFMMNHRYPFVALMITVDTDKVDVNVHPTKMEVRFSDSKMVYDNIFHAIHDALMDNSLVPSATLDATPPIVKEEIITYDIVEPFETQRENVVTSNKPEIPLPKDKPAPFANHEVPITRTEYHQTSIGEIHSDAVPTGPAFRMIGQVFGTYWLVEYEDELLIIDQHAAHEKVLYEKIMNSLREKKGITQTLAAPIVVTLSAREVETLNEYKNSFLDIGFTIEPFGDKEYIITGVPGDFLDLASKDLFLDMLDEMMQEHPSGEPDLVLDHCATMACKAAVKGNHNMSYAEARELIKQMLNMKEPYHCPHGRPTTISMSKQEFEKKFKRIV